MRPTWHRRIRQVLQTCLRLCCQPSIIPSSADRGSRRATATASTPLMPSQCSHQPRHIIRCQSNHLKALAEARPLSSSRACKLQLLTIPSTLSRRKMFNLLPSAPKMKVHKRRKFFNTHQQTKYRNKYSSPPLRKHTTISLQQ